MRSASLVTGFFLRTLVWLALALPLWAQAGPWFALPPAWLAEQMMRGGFEYWVLGSELEGTTQTLLTALTVRSPDGRIGELLPSAEILSYAYGTPLACALLMASRPTGWWWRLPLAMTLLVPFQAAGVCLTWLMQVAVIAGSDTAAQTGFGLWQTNAIAAGYQFGYLILPTLVPTLVWLSLDRSFVAKVVLEGALSAVANSAPIPGRSAPTAPTAGSAEPVRMDTDSTR
ncbi:MAG: hypothetical protein KDG52_01970 [Rhodocyclaceae bacterium]|nr:hypothetical protein [Rhodocyclaceae bacterium]